MKAATVAGPISPTTGVTFDGMDAATLNGLGTIGFGLPPDPNSDTGPNDIVEMVNSAIAIYSKTGAQKLAPRDINLLWSTHPAGDKCATNNDGDPVVKYDRLADRWLVSQFAVTDNSGNFQAPYDECIAISQTPNPAGAYYTYTFFLGNNQITDYPHFGVWPDAYYMSTNLFADSDQSFSGPGATAFDRTAMLAGDPLARMVNFQILDSNFGGQLPSDLNGTTVPPAGSPNY